MSNTDFVLKVYRSDRRRSEGERLSSREEFLDVSTEWIERYAHQVEAQRGVTRVEFFPKYVTVKNLLTGKDIEIRTEDRGTVCDPSRETYWSM